MIQNDVPSPALWEVFAYVFLIGVSLGIYAIIVVVTHVEPPCIRFRAELWLQRDQYSI